MIVLKSNFNEKTVSESDLYKYLRYDVLECAGKRVNKTDVQLLLCWIFQITSIYIGFDADNGWLEVSADEKSIGLYNTGIEKALINQFGL